MIEGGDNVSCLIQHWSDWVNKHLKASLLNKLQKHICTVVIQVNISA